MTVYVDDMAAPYGRYVMCHMIADTLPELHAMADRIGVQRKWFQHKISGDHYDIALSKRKLALRYGAVPIMWCQCAAMCRRFDVTGKMGDPATSEAWLKGYHSSLEAEWLTEHLYSTYEFFAKLRIDNLIRDL